MATQTIVPRRTQGLTLARRWAWGTLVFLVLVVLWGAVVRATASGAGCGDHWPLCNGQFVPRHPVLATVIEFTHRSMSGISTALVAVMIGLTFWSTPRRHPARRAAVMSGLLLVTEALLGALLVLKHWVVDNASTGRVVAQGIHFSNTMLLLAAVTLTGCRLRMRAGRSFREWPTGWGVLAILGLLLAGATGSVAALADTIFPASSLHAALAADFAASSPTLIKMRWVHPAAALLCTVATCFWCGQLNSEGRHRAALMLMSNVVVQIAVGLADVLLLAPVTLQVLHLLSADVFWIVAVAVFSAPAIVDGESPRVRGLSHLPI